MLLADCKNWSQDENWGKDLGEVTRVAWKSRGQRDRVGNKLVNFATHCGAFPLSLEFCFEKNKFVLVYFGSSGYTLRVRYFISFPYLGVGREGRPRSHRSTVKHKATR